MKSKLRILTLVLLAAAGALSTRAAAQQTPLRVGAEDDLVTAARVSGRQLVQQAARSLASEPAFEAKIRQRVEVFSRRMVGTGVYRQQRVGNRRMARLELKLQLNNEITSVQHISNGRFLWIRRDLPGDRRLSRVDLNAVRAALATPPAGQGGGRSSTPPTAGDLSSSIALGGLPDLVAGAARRFQFAAPEAGVMQTVPVWIVRGAWRPELLAELVPQHRDAILTGTPLTMDQLPPQLPSEVVLVLSRDEAWPLFPYRIEFRRPAPTKQDPENTSAMMTMEFFEVRRGVRFHPQEFQYELGDQKIDADETERYIARLRNSGAVAR